MDDEADASSLFFHASRSSNVSGEQPKRLAHLAASFRLSNAEIDFFDAVIGSLPDVSDSFGHLKRAYDAQMRVPSLVHPVARAMDLGLEDIAAVDARLWNTLLALVQVRGHTWAERWDAVRVSLGLDPWVSDEDDTYSMHELTRALQTPASPTHMPGPSIWAQYDAPSATYSPWSSPRSVSSDDASGAKQMIGALRRLFLRMRAAEAERMADAKIVQAAWQTWWIRFTERTVAWRDYQAHAEAQWARRRTERAWTKWMQRTAHWERQAQYAECTHAKRTLWAAEAALRADGAARLRTLHGAWRQWCSAQQAARARRLRAAHVSRLRGDMFRAWRLRAAQAQHRRTGAALLEARTAVRLQRTCLARWLHHARARRATFQDVAQHADTQCTARALAHWRARCRTMRARATMADALRAAYDQDRVRHALHTWVRAHRLGVLQTAWRASRDGRRRAAAWEKWRDALAHAALSYEEYATLAARRRWMLRRCFAHWLGRTSVLPAVEHRRSALQAHAFRRWVEKLRARQREATARAFVQATVLCDALATWRAKRAYLAELRAVQGLQMRARRTSSDTHFRRRLAFVAPTSRFS
ncbi:hypothetical protein MBRA1_001031 [Malassezia brasiliensis]|uniref:Sfi1 spindle body domain-containing protein n=1 Tax=Malassezia brasiliensis TaxID=1821822 RepID=A0AAF0DRN0_9BASI|nr:hypothetical protein MBRA1_001031 [Malassezia brasiliensis]